MNVFLCVLFCTALASAGCQGEKKETRLLLFKNKKLKNGNDKLGQVCCTN